VVYSTTLKDAPTARTRVEPRFDPEAVRALKRRGDVSVGGPGLAASAIRAGLVDEYHWLVVPVVGGGRTPVFPDGDARGPTWWNSAGSPAASPTCATAPGTSGPSPRGSRGRRPVRRPGRAAALPPSWRSPGDGADNGMVRLRSRLVRPFRYPVR